MGQLLKVASVSMQTMRFSQDARLVPVDHVNIERKKVMARHFALHSRYSSRGNTVDLSYVSQVSRFFAGARTHSRPTGSAGWSAGPPPSGGRSAGQRPQAVSKENGLAASGSGPVSHTTNIPVLQISIPETRAACTTQRGSFELRVTTGEFSYLPPMTVIIIAQYPEIHFEYLGGLHYFLPPEDFTEGNMNLSIWEQYIYVKIHADYYGEIEYSKKDLVTFPEGLFGFPDLRYYLPLCLSDDDDSMLILQSTEKSEVVFLFINLAFLYPDYLPGFTSEELSYLKMSDSGELSYYVICAIKDNYMDNTANLKCPLAINPLTRVGMQVILENSPYGLHHELDSLLHVAV